MKNQLVQEAIQYANDFRERKRNLDKTLRDLETKATETKAHLHATDLAIERLNGFRAEIGGELQCPRCWVAQGVNSPLIATPSDDDTDWLKCRICNSEYEVSG